MEPPKLLGPAVHQENAVGDDLVDVDDRRSSYNNTASRAEKHIVEATSQGIFGDKVDNGDTYDDKNDGLSTNNYNTLEIVDENVDELRASYRKKFSMHDLTEDRTKS